jgi:hypothetical protein
VRVVYAFNEVDVLYRLSRRGNDKLPGLLLFDGPPVRRDFARFVENMRKQPFVPEIPIALFLSPVDTALMQQWLRGEDIHFYPRTSKPSECKFFARQMLESYVDGGVVPKA